ncbi:MAG: Cof-type HAD-IIB family hydrolase [Limnochordia bacterium]|jgi:Cof subfamily protein (haloacid dehalogenase superfamily)|nr:Cof-type HAD-IIB family hydrolase [Limnochordia bacterium]
MKYKLLALDIDGTLLNGKSELTPRTKSAVLRAKQRVEVILATGRRLTNTLPLVKELGLQAPVVVHNGAVLYDPSSGKTLSQWGIDLHLAREIVDKLDSRGINYIVYTGESRGEQVLAPLGSWQEPEDLLTHYLGEQVDFVERVTLAAPPVRISVIDRTGEVDSFSEELNSKYGGMLNALVFGTERNIWRGIEMIPADCNKGAGLATVVESLGFGAEDVVAIGDNINDLEMIAWAGLGIAMENGSSQLKATAKRIAPRHDQDGVAQIIEELLF